MNVFTFLRKTQNFSKTAVISVSVFLFGLSGILAYNQRLEIRKIFENIVLPSQDLVSTNTKDAEEQVVQSSMVAPCTEDFECIGKVNLSVGLTCEASIEGDMLFVNPTGLNPDTFIIVIMEPGGAIRDTNLFTIADIGKTFKVSIKISGCDDPPCWSDVLIEDKMPPSIVCAEDVTIACSMDQTDVVAPVAMDNCSAVVTMVSSAYFPYPCANPNSAAYLGYYIIKWKATDGYNNDTTCDQTVMVARTDFSGIDWPDASIELECSLVAPGGVTIAQGGVPTLNGSPLYPINEDVCMASLTYKDTLISNPNACTKFIRRDWELIQWTCGAPLIDTYSQLIRIVDNTPPNIAAIPDLTVLMTSGECTQKIKLPKAIAKDACQPVLRYEVIYTGGIGNVNEPTVQLGMGIHTITYNVYDVPCGNVATETFNIFVQDKVAPIAICSPVNVVSLTDEGYGVLTADQVGIFSYDYCGDPVTLEIQRMEKGCIDQTKLWYDEVNFCCSDVGKDLMVAIKVTDSNGNTNVCMTSVIIQNKIIPEGIYPEDTIIKCSYVYDRDSLNRVFGAPMIVNTFCQNTGTFRETTNFVLNVCGNGKIYRNWQLIFNGSVVEIGSQTIMVMPDIIFNPDTIIWPAEVVYANIDSTDTIYTGSPFIPFVPCNMVMVNFSEDTLKFGSGGTCFKILRTWKVINWCSTEPTNPIAEFTQTIIVEDKIAPVISSSTALVTVCSFEATCVASNEYVILKASATDNGTQPEDLVWYYDIDLFKDGSINASGSGDSVYFLAPVGLHKVTFTVYDGCGSSNTTTYDFEVKNCKAPSPKCIGLVTKLMEVPPTGGEPMVEICAKEFDAGSDDICTPSDSLRFTFNMAYPVDSLIYVPHYFKGMGILATEAEYLTGDAQRWDPIERTSCKVFDCDEAPRTLIFMTIWDLDKNKDQCQVMIELQGGPCCPDNTNPIITTLDTTRFIKNTSPECNGPMKVLVSATATDNVPDSLLKWTFMVDFNKNGSIDTMGIGRSITLSFGVDTHKVTFIVEDTCRNKDTVMFDIVIFNDKGPRAICRSLPFELILVDMDGAGPMGSMGFVKAKQLDNISTPSADSCSSDLLYYTFNGSFPVITKLGIVHFFTGNGIESDSAAYVAGNAQKWDPVLLTSELKFDCTDIGSKSITLTVWDSSRKSSSCTTTINISGDCPCGDITKPVISTSDSMRNFCIVSPRCDSIQVTLSATASDAPTPAARLSWTYSIDYFKNGSVDVSGNATGGTVNVSPLTPIGTHNVTFIVQDTCGNRDTLLYMFRVRNCNPPVCTTRSVTITPIDMDGNGPLAPMWELRADTLNAGSTDICTPANQLIYTFNGAYPVVASINAMHFFKGIRQTATEAEYLAGTAQKWIPEIRSSRLKITCPAPSIVQMTVWDADTLSSSCNAAIIVNCPQSLCEANPFTGYMAITCQVNTENTGSPLGAIYNVRKNATAPSTSNWVLTPIVPSNWYLDSIGQIFGLATDDSANVYLASSDVYLYPSIQPGGIPTGNIYKARPPLFRAEVFATLPNTGGDFNGIGNIVYDRKHNQLFATNLEDGKIYRISNTGAILSMYDPFVADNGNNGIVVQSEQIWGLGINYESDSTKLYFPRISGATRELWSLKLLNSGAFPAANTHRRELSTLPGDEVRITDIAFSNSSQSMLMAERGGATKVSPVVPITQGSHSSIAAKFNKIGNAWSFDKVLSIGSNVELEFQAGNPGVSGIVFGQNSAGGVDFGPEQIGLDTFARQDGIMWASGNWLHKGVAYTNASRDSLYYGAQGIKFDSTGNVRRDIVIDYNNNGSGFNDKGLIGDLEVFRCIFTNSGGNFAGVNGNLKTFKGDLIEKAKVIVEGSEERESMTDADGEYDLKDLSKGNEYFVKPVKDDDHKNGLNVLDILHMQRHILGVKRLDKPESMIAADVNNDEEITIADMVALRKLVLGVTTRFDNNTSWRFLDANYVFEDANNPWLKPLQEVYNIQSLTGNMNVDFKGIKIGDLDGNALANTKALKQRSLGQKQMYISELDMKQGEEVMVPIYASNDDVVEALQLVIDLKDLELVDVISGSLEIQNADIFIDKNQVVILYTNSDGKNVSGDKELFYLKMRSNKSNKLGNCFKINEGSISYNDANGESTLELEVRNGEVGNETTFMVHQNKPNPWNNTTSIAYELPSDGNVKFEVRDLTGKLLVNQQLAGRKGLNEIYLEDKNFSSNGIYIYTIKYGTEIVNKKMIFITK